MLPRRYLENLDERIADDLRAPRDCNGSHISINSTQQSYIKYVFLYPSFQGKGSSASGCSTPPVPQTSFMARGGLSNIAPF
jgi:hypothetical protein